MDSIPQLYSDYQFSQEFQSSISCTSAGNIGCSVASGSFWGDQEGLTVPSFDHYALDQIVSSESDSPSSVRSMSFFDQYGVLLPDLDVPAMPVFNMGKLIVDAEVQSFSFYQPQACELGEDYCGYVPDLKPVCPLPSENWECQGNQLMNIPASIEDPNIKVCRYTEEQRKERILRYLKKRNQRNFNKTIKYECRKTLADRRTRVRGRFARNSDQPSNQEIGVNKNGSPNQGIDSYTGAGIQIKQDKEWLQEVASLMYLPCITSIDLL